MKPKPKKIGRPKGEPKRQTRFMWSIPVAELLEKHRDFIEKNLAWIIKKIKGKK